MKRNTLRQNAKFIAAAAGIASVAVLSPVTISAKKSGENITICHATSSEKNPYVQKSVDPQGVINGHLGHDGDIVAPFVYDGVTYSQNWDEVGMVTYDNACVPQQEIRD